MGSLFHEAIVRPPASHESQLHVVLDRTPIEALREDAVQYWDPENGCMKRLNPEIIGELGRCGKASLDMGRLFPFVASQYRQRVKSLLMPELREPDANTLAHEKLREI